MLVFALVLASFACREEEGVGRGKAGDEVRIELEGSSGRRLLAFHVGGMVSSAAADPFASGHVAEIGGTYVLRLDRFEGAVGAALREAGADGEVDWDEFEAIVAEAYYDFRPLPRTTDSLRNRVGDWRNERAWFGFSVDGVMSPDTRTIRVPVSQLAKAIAAYPDNGNAIVYDAGTTFVSETSVDGRPVETSVMTKRADGFWDFYAYGPDGRLLRILERERSDLVVPTRCVGCHFGNRLFEPERSFPVDPPPGPDGPRKVYVPESMKNGEIVAALDEHRKRTDTILGLYATLLISRIQQERLDGTVDPVLDEALRAGGF